MNNKGQVFIALSSAVVALAMGCTSAPEPVDPAIALRAGDRLAAEPTPERERAVRVVMVESERDAETVLSLEVDSSDGRVHFRHEFPLRRLDPAGSERVAFVGCPVENADGLTESGQIGDYANSYVCVDSGRSTIEQVVVDVHLSSGSRSPGRPASEFELDEVLRFKYREPSTLYLPRGAVARVKFHDPGMSSNYCVNPSAGGGPEAS
jgi:hypothetical protein